jgi:hypothetical protein
MDSLILFLIFIGLGIVALRFRKSAAVARVTQSGEIRDRSAARLAAIAAPVLFGLAVLILIFGMFVTIQPGQVGVQVLFGETKPDILERKWHPHHQPAC